MNKRISAGFIYCSAVILFISAVFTLITARSQVQVLERLEPLCLLFSIRVWLYGLAALQLVVSAFLLINDKIQINLLVIASIATQLLLYRLYAASESVPDWVACIGNFTDWVPISPRLGSYFNTALTAGLFAGSYGLLIVQRLVAYRNRAVPRTQLASLVTEPANQSTI